MNSQQNIFSLYNLQQLYQQIPSLQQDKINDILNKFPEIVQKSCFVTDVIFESNQSQVFYEGCFFALIFNSIIKGDIYDLQQIQTTLKRNDIKFELLQRYNRRNELYELLDKYIKIIKELSQNQDLLFKQSQEVQKIEISKIFQQLINDAKQKQHLFQLATQSICYHNIVRDIEDYKMNINNENENNVPNILENERNVQYVLHVLQQEHIVWREMKQIEFDFISLYLKDTNLLINVCTLDDCRDIKENAPQWLKMGPIDGLPNINSNFCFIKYTEEPQTDDDQLKIQLRLGFPYKLEDFIVVICSNYQKLFIKYQAQVAWKELKKKGFKQ